MFVVEHAGLLYGPFKTANEAADFPAEFAGPWQILKLQEPLSEEAKAAILEKWKAAHG